MLDEAHVWLAFIYNLRGYEMTNEVWTKFKEFVESRPEILLRDPRFTQLPGKREE